MQYNPIGRLVSGLVVAGLVTTLTAVASPQAPAGRTPPLPPAILKAFQQAYPGATISATSQERDAGRTVIRVDSVDKGRRRIVLYDPDSTVIEVADQVDDTELPRPVAAAMHSHPRAIYVSGMKVTRGGSVRYELTLRGTRKTAMVAKPDGTVVSFK
jgi:hypothetical protein